MKKVISFKTKLGWIYAIEKNKKISLINFGKRKNTGISKNLIGLKKDIMNYFTKKNKKFNLEIFLEGSKLQIKILKELQKIPYGFTKSYGDIAKKVKTSPRYVGNVCAKNKHLLVVPCHRVIRNDGSLGGFSAPNGIALKKKLLNLEQT